MSHVKDLRKEAKKAVLSLAKGNWYFLRERSGLLADIKEGQHPKIILYMCSDSRVQMDSIAPYVFTEYDPLNRIFTIENAGNRLDHPMLSASATYGAVHVPETSLLFIMGHTGCGAVKGSLMGEEQINLERDDLAKYLLQIKTYLEGNFRNQKALQGDDLFDGSSQSLSALAELNVDFQVATTLSRYKDLVDSSKITVVGGMFDIHGNYKSRKGQLGHLIITNFNGVTELDDIRKSLALGLEYNVERLTKGIPSDKIRLMVYKTEFYLAK
ncbi:hypothetical protein HYX03_04385 [Candidatus Woesearchaeota archaeon]|nr:hypothetical protein [Candidatus Woesearchaeota archaeon]